MSAPSVPHCVLGRLMPIPATNGAELFAMRCRAWCEQGIVVLPIQNIEDPWLRQAITNEANRLYGQTMARTR